LAIGKGEDNGEEGVGGIISFREDVTMAKIEYNYPIPFLARLQTSFPEVPLVVFRRSRAAQQGSILLMLAIVVFVFMSVSVIMSYSQILHAERLNVDQSKLQALYAAEAGVFAAFNAKSDLGLTTLYKDTRGEATYQATRSTSTEPHWITGVGTAVVHGERMVATVRGYVVARQIVMWDFE
jgi:hypothetical protein